MIKSISWKEMEKIMDDIWDTDTLKGLYIGIRLLTAYGILVRTGEESINFVSLAEPHTYFGELKPKELHETMSEDDVDYIQADTYTELVDWGLGKYVKGWRKNED